MVIDKKGINRTLWRCNNAKKRMEPVTACSKLNNQRDFQNIIHQL